MVLTVFAALQEYPNVLVLRVRMPIVMDLTYPRNFITKIIKYDKVGDASAVPFSLKQQANKVVPSDWACGCVRLGTWYCPISRL